MPQNFKGILDFYAMSGKRVLACGVRILSGDEKEILSLERNDIEQDFIFLGLLVMENSIKEESFGAVQILHKANLRTIMVFRIF